MRYGVVGVFILVGAASAVFWGWPRSQDLVVRQLTVGSSTAVYIATPTGVTALIGGAQNTDVLRQLSNYMYWYRRTIDVLVVTKLDDRHTSGMVDVLARYRIRLIILPNVMPHTPTGYAFERSLTTARRSGSIISRLSGSETLDIGGVYVEIESATSSLFARVI